MLADHHPPGRVAIAGSFPCQAGLRSGPPVLSAGEPAGPKREYALVPGWEHGPPLLGMFPRSFPNGHFGLSQSGNLPIPTPCRGADTRAMTDDFPILAAVAANPTHPYELLEHLQALGVRATRSTLYRRVDGLIERGYLEAEDGRGESGHFRRLLRLTAKGRDAAGREAAEVLRREPLESPLFALAVAAAGISQREDALGVLRTRMAAAARRLTDEERALREEAVDPWGQAARERRIAHLQADISWLQGLLGRRGVERGTDEVRRAG